MPRTVAVAVDTVLCEGGYWDQVGCEFQQPAWLTDTGIPLIVTTLGLAAAFLLVRRQIRHDQELRLADRRASAVNAFGVEMNKIVSSFWHVTGTSDWWLKPEWPEWSDTFKAEEQLKAKLGEADPFPELYKSCRDILYIWKACSERRRALSAGGLNVDVLQHSSAMDSVLTARVAECQSASEALISWDGHGPLPDMRRNGPHLHVPLPVVRRRKKYKRWMAYYADEYERHLRQHMPPLT